VETEDRVAAGRFGLLIVDKRNSWVEQWLVDETEGWPDDYEEARARRAAARPKFMSKKDVPFLLGFLALVALVILGLKYVPVVTLPPVLAAGAVLGLQRPLTTLLWKWRLHRGLSADEARRIAAGRVRRVGASPRRPVEDPLQTESLWVFRVETADPLAREAFGLLTVDRHDGWVDQLPAGTSEAGWAPGAERRRAERVARERAAFARERRFRRRLALIEAGVVALAIAALLVFARGFSGWLASALILVLFGLAQVIPAVNKGLRDEYWVEVDRRRRAALEPLPGHRSVRAPPRGGSLGARDLLEPLPIRRT
jgi:hypothetical protein